MKPKRAKPIRGYACVVNGEIWWPIEKRRCDLASGNPETKIITVEIREIAKPRKRKAGR